MSYDTDDRLIFGGSDELPQRWISCEPVSHRFSNPVLLCSVCVDLSGHLCELHRRSYGYEMQLCRLSVPATKTQHRPRGLVANSIARAYQRRKRDSMSSSRPHNVGPCLAQETRRVGALNAGAGRNWGCRSPARKVHVLPRNNAGSLLPEGVQHGRMSKSWSVVGRDRGRCMRPLIRYCPTQRYVGVHKYSGTYNAAPAIMRGAAPGQKVRR